MSEIREELKEPKVEAGQTAGAGQESDAGRETDTRQKRETYEHYEDFGREEILELLHKGQYTRLRQVVQELNDADIADYIEEMDEEEIVKIFRILPKDMAASVFS